MKRRTYAVMTVGICLGLNLSLWAGQKDSAASKEEKGNTKTTDNVVAKLIEKVPADFSRFEFRGNKEQAELLSHYLWYHFHHRMGMGPELFNKEYLAVADMWLGNAYYKDTEQRIQDRFRELFLKMQMDREGYVLTNQHFSHAHDHGWPFPAWTHSDYKPERVKGKTVGWHFQELEDVPHWVGDSLRVWKGEEYVGEQAAAKWELENVKSLGIKNKRWYLEATGDSPMIITPQGYALDAFNAPYLQLRWKRSGEPRDHFIPYVEWLREEDEKFQAERRVYFYLEKTPLSGEYFHSIMTMYRHPLWKGNIKKMRICLAPGESEVKFEIDSFFTVYDTRHTINNPIFILANCCYFGWTGDLDFLRNNIDRMRMALRYQQTVMGGLKYNRIRNPWPGHDGLTGFSKDEKGNLTIYSGHGIGSNYWDVLPFGWDDFYATYQYYAATEAMADLEEAIEKHPGWNMPLGVLKLDPEWLREHAALVKRQANQLFWNEKTGRFNAWIDKKGKGHDYGFTFLNLDAIWYGIASDEHARAIMDWIDGKRIVETDTAKGKDIYRWRFGPRATTLRNVECYAQVWYGPEGIPWGGQVQDGGAVLGFSFFDLWARLKILGPDNAWQRLKEILAWEKEVHGEGGYRKYYEGGKRGTTLQGSGQAGGLGIDKEFFESSLIPAIVVFGFLGLDTQGFDSLAIRPKLPSSCPEMKVNNVMYRNVLMDIQVSDKKVLLQIKGKPVEDLRIAFEGIWQQENTHKEDTVFLISDQGSYCFIKQ